MDAKAPIVFLKLLNPNKIGDIGVEINGEKYVMGPEQTHEMAWNTSTALVIHYNNISYSIRTIVNDGEELWVDLQEDHLRVMRGTHKFLPWTSAAPSPSSPSRCRSPSHSDC